MTNELHMSAQGGLWFRPVEAFIYIVIFFSIGGLGSDPHVRKLALKVAGRG